MAKVDVRWITSTVRMGCVPHMQFVRHMRVSVLEKSEVC